MIWCSPVFFFFFFVVLLERVDPASIALQLLSQGYSHALLVATVPGGLVGVGHALTDLTIDLVCVWVLFLVF
jgi:hypothetical protein